MTQAISAAAMRCRTMADGSLRIEVEVEPADAQTAFAMFGKPGAPMALAALTPGYASADTEPSERQKGGPLAKLAGQWCQMPEFYAWLRDTMPRVAEQFNDLQPELASAAAVRGMCQVTSRSELDHHADAAERFHRYFRVPFSEWLRATDPA